MCFISFQIFDGKVDYLNTGFRELCLENSFNTTLTEPHRLA